MEWAEVRELRCKMEARRKKRKRMERDVPTNLFYVASPSVLEGSSAEDWKRASLHDALEHARSIIRSTEQEVCYVVQIVAVVRTVEPLHGMAEVEPPIEVISVPEKREWEPLPASQPRLCIRGDNTMSRFKHELDGVGQHRIVWQTCRSGAGVLRTAEVGEWVGYQQIASLNHAGKSAIAVTQYYAGSALEPNHIYFVEAAEQRATEETRKLCDHRYREMAVYVCIHCGKTP